MVNKHTSIVTLIRGEGVSDEDAQIVQKCIQSKIGNHIDVTMINGGQPIYYFIVSVE